MAIGKLGVFALLDFKTAPETAAFAKRVEQWGYGALWIHDGLGRDAVAFAAWLLANTETLNIATGPATIYARDAIAAKHAQLALSEQWNSRFQLCLVASHQGAVEARGHRYGEPHATMKAYLETMANASYGAPQPPETPKTLIAAHAPDMMELAASPLADGAITYVSMPDHTAWARKVLGPGKLLSPALWVLLETDAEAARAIAKRSLVPFLELPTYRENCLRFGFTDQDVLGGGSDRLVDAIVAWGDEDAIRRRIQDHWDAGADHVYIQPLARDGWAISAEDETVLRLLAPE